MYLSVRGIARRYRGRTGSVSVRSHVFPWWAPAAPSLRNRLVSLARQQVSFSVSECIYGWTASYEQTWSLIRVRIRLNPDADVSAATMNTLRARWREGIEDTWSDQWAISRRGEFTCPLRFEVHWVTANPHHTVRVRTGPGRANMTRWFTTSQGGTAAHEYGHMLSHPDEYADSNCPDRSPVGTGTVMHNNSANVPARLVRRFASAVGSNVVAIP